MYACRLCCLEPFIRTSLALSLKSGVQIIYWGGLYVGHYGTYCIFGNISFSLDIRGGGA